jgi:acetylornithine deacetylase
MRGVRDAVDANWERQVEFLRGLVSRRSTLGEEAAVQRFIADELAELGLEPDVWDVDAGAIARLPGYGPVEWSFDGRPNVAARMPAAAGGGRSLVFQGHIDVVPATPEHRWTRDPWGGEVADGRMWGRGAADMKAGVAAMIFAARALRDAGVELRGDLSLVTVIEEECTGNGALSALDRGYVADAAVIPEPFGHAALEAQVGVLWARVTVRGQGAHAERATEVQNAVVKAARVIQAVGEVEAAANRDELRHPQFASTPHPLNYNVGIARGGDWASSVPEECVLEVRIAAYPGEHLPDVQERFRRELVAAVSDDPWLAEHPPEVTFYAFRADGFVIARDAPIMRTLAAAHADVVGGELEFLTFTATTDARLFNLYYGTPATCYGPLGGNLHAPDEWVDLESVRNVTKVLAETAIEWCGVKNSGEAVEGIPMTPERQAVHVATKSGEPRGIALAEERFDPSGLAVAVSGELDIATAPALRDRLNDAIDAGTRRFVIDLSDVSFIDSVALATIVHAKQRLPEDGKLAIAADPESYVMLIFESSGLANVLDLVGSRAEAIEHVSA